MVYQKVEFWKELHEYISVIDIAREPIPWKKSIKGGTAQTGGSWIHTKCKCKFIGVFPMIFYSSYYFGTYQNLILFLSYP